LWSRRWKTNSEERGGWPCRHVNRRLGNNPLFFFGFLFFSFSRRPPVCWNVTGSKSATAVARSSLVWHPPVSSCSDAPRCVWCGPPGQRLRRPPAGTLQRQRQQRNTPSRLPTAPLCVCHRDVDGRLANQSTRRQRTAARDSRSSTVGRSQSMEIGLIRAVAASSPHPPPSRDCMLPEMGTSRQKRHSVGGGHAQHTRGEQQKRASLASRPHAHSGTLPLLLPPIHRLAVAVYLLT